MKRSRDGHWIVYGDDTFGHAAVCAVDPATGAPTGIAGTVHVAGDTILHAAAFSPDGRHLLYSSIGVPGGLRIARFTGDPATGTVTFGPVTCTPNPGFPAAIKAIDFSPDGRWLAVGYGANAGGVSGRPQTRSFVDIHPWDAATGTLGPPVARSPRRAGQDLANPSGLFLGAVQMLVHIGQGDVAARVHNAWLKTIEDGVHTYDIFDPAVSTEKVGTTAFADAVIARLGEAPATLKAVTYAASAEPIRVAPKARPLPTKEFVGLDVFVEWRAPVEDLAKVLEEHTGPDLRLVMISNRGQKVWPGGMPETFCVDHWRCRFQSATEGSPVSHAEMIELLTRLDRAGLPFLKTEGLYTFDGKPGFSLGQGQ